MAEKAALHKVDRQTGSTKPQAQMLCQLARYTAFRQTTVPKSLQMSVRVEFVPIHHRLLQSGTRRLPERPQALSITNERALLFKHVPVWALPILRGHAGTQITPRPLYQSCGPGRRAAADGPMHRRTSSGWSASRTVEMTMIGYLW
ncbi:hypothetical protein GGTG_07105 [Gaeumannomyces tritici R3-111a-1]|uniref:Uncharacterized protein n=1 Tax=Gaeumannomyces tritici (strain R3-111a-1) TaxID=644352 RepID=J3P0R0_GAET3|nr:hypothetical protein GGTG_07105 [Gaeumannomyces tritici R3-111a-1]EJT77193.1 hypothetical protein GGTG_07105 [Gaeumannomyces tritici R3-111a-1]